MYLQNLGLDPSSELDLDLDVELAVVVQSLFDCWFD